MANPEHVRVVRQGRVAIVEWRRTHPHHCLDLHGAYLIKANLSWADLSEADLSGAILSGANLSRDALCGANLHRANLRGADLTMADLSGAILSGANLNGANLNGANLSRAELYGAALSGAAHSGADFEDVSLGSTILGNVDLSSVQRLEKIWHVGPSTIGIDTLYRSGGNIPEAFLDGAGVPKDMIEFARSLRGRPIQFYSVFISHSTKDQLFAERLYADLRGNQVRCWFAPHDIQGGRKLHEQINQAIEVHDRLLLVLSEASIASPWVEHEIRTAIDRQVREKRQILFPLGLCAYDTLRTWKCFNADTGRDMATEIREYYIPDFSTWESDQAAYRREFDRLLRDLQAPVSPPSE